MPPPIKGNSIGATWGTTGTVGAGTALGNGIIRRASKNLDGKVTELADNDDEAVAAVLHDDRYELEADIVMGSTSAEPTRGNAITIGGVTGTVLGATTNWETGGWKSMKVRARKWAKITS